MDPQQRDFHPKKDLDSKYYSTKDATPKEENDIDEPWRDGPWIIWPNSTLSAITISDCNDTVEGICYKDLSIQECMQRCPGDNCGFGLYTKFKNGESICTPIRSIVHPELTPLYRLRNQSYYNLDPNVVSMSVFVNTNLFPFPPNFANTVFYGDVLALKNVDSGLTLNTEIPRKKGGGPCIMDKPIDSILTLQPKVRTANSVIHDQPIVFGDDVILSVKGSSYVAQVQNDGGVNPIVWKEALGILGGIGTAFKIIPVDPTKKIGDLVTYSDEIAFQYKGIGMIAVNKDKDPNIGLSNPSSRILYLSTSPILMSHAQYKKYRDSMKGEDMSEDSENVEQPFSMKFTFQSLMNVFYCDDDGTCKEAPPDKVKAVPFPAYSNWNRRPPSNVLSSGTFEGKPVFNHRGCWGMCPAIQDGPGHGKNVISLAGDQHIPPDYLPDTQPDPLWEQTHNRNMKILWVSIGIAVTILMIITGFVVYRRFRKSGRT